jgi:flagellar biosynthesis anti-sigma factor FlgM
MKVDLNASALIQQTTTLGTKQAPQSSIASYRPVTGDRTTLSSDSASVQSLVAKVLAFPSVRQDRVTALRQTISDGNYKVDADKIASALATSGEWVTQARKAHIVVEALPTSIEFASSYLQTLQTLAAEMTTAMRAIAGNALSDLEDSVTKQEVLCAALVSMKKSVPVEIRSAAHRSLLPQLASVNALNQQYAALLRYTGSSVALLSALCQSHTGRSQEARNARLKHQTWSCEI